MKKELMLAICTITIASFLSGCGGSRSLTGSTKLYENWGKSYETAKYMQILHPEAGGALVVEGLDGQAADTINKQYQKSFTQKQKMTASESILNSIVN